MTVAYQMTTVAILRVLSLVLASVKMWVWALIQALI
jgi:hypothetical protein